MPLVTIALGGATDFAWWHPGIVLAVLSAATLVSAWCRPRAARAGVRPRAGHPGRLSGARQPARAARRGPGVPDSLDSVAGIARAGDLVQARIEGLSGTVDAAHAHLAECIVAAHPSTAST